MDITFLYFEDCPSHEKALARLRTVLAEENIEPDIEIVKVETEAEAEQYQFVGSPTIRRDGQDIIPPPEDAPYALTCRAYFLDDGRISPLPSAEMIRQGLQATA